MTDDQGQQQGGKGGAHDNDHGHGDSLPSLGSGISNWRRSDLSFTEKMRLATRNSLIKLRNRSSCCGHHGEPGC